MSSRLQREQWGKKSEKIHSLGQSPHKFRLRGRGRLAAEAHTHMQSAAVSPILGKYPWSPISIPILYISVHLLIKTA